MSSEAIVQVRVQGVMDEAAAYGVQCLAQYAGAAGAKPLHVLCAYAGTPEGDALAQRGVPCPDGAEAFSIAPLADNELAVLASDHNGLMYGCFELLEALEQSGGRPEKIGAFAKTPYVKIRGLYKFLHNADCERPWFYSRAYWTRLFDSMARDRYNSYNLVVSHQTSYLAPIFAHFLDMSEFPEVRATNITKEEIQENGEMLRFISHQAAARGINFIIGIWQVTPWMGDGHDWHHSQPTFMEGLTFSKNLEAYTYAGMRKLIAQFPDIRGLQIRANEESGIKRDKQTAFYHNTLLRAMRECGRPFIFDLRCWAVEKDTYTDALAYEGTRLSCKYWGEFMGAPYQPAKTIPGYCYANMLEQPMTRDFVWQVWSLGSPRLLVWGDPAYARRFIESTKLGGANGFEMNLQLAQKGYGNAPGEWRMFKDPEAEYYDFEDERYWFFQSVFGRYGYDPDAGEAAYLPALKARFGSLAERVLDVYQRGSNIITYLTHYSLSDPNMYVWPEIDTGGVLDHYIQTPSFDPCVIKNILEQVQEEVSGALTGRFAVEQTADYFEKMATDTFAAIARLEQGAPAQPEGAKELCATLIDFKTLAYLALYHADKTRAGLALARWYQTPDIAILREAYANIRHATTVWEKLIQCTQDRYYDDMVTGPTDAGCWKTKLPLVYEDEMRVAELIALYEKNPSFYKAFDFGAPFVKPEPRVRGDFKLCHQYAVERGYTAATTDSVYTPEAGFGFERGTPVAIEMPSVRLTDHHFDPWTRDSMTSFPAEKMKGYRSPLLEDALCGEGPAVFRVDVPAGRYKATLIVHDQTPAACVRGPFSVRMGAQTFDGIVVMPLQEKRFCAEVDVKDGAFRVELDGAWFISALILRPMAPVITTYPRASLTREDRITATVYAPSGIACCKLLLNAGGGEQHIPMTQVRPHEYEVELADALAGIDTGDYQIEATACDGSMAQSANVSFHVRRALSSFSFRHTPITAAQAGVDAPLTLAVDSALPIQWVRLHYSCANHFIPVESVDMTFDGKAWQGRIPGSAFDPHWVMMYWFEVLDDCGSGALYPDFREQTPYYVVQVK